MVQCGCVAAVAIGAPSYGHPVAMQVRLPPVYFPLLCFPLFVCPLLFPPPSMCSSSELIESGPIPVNRI